MPGTGVSSPRALPPEAADTVRTALLAPAPGWRLDSANLQTDRVEARMCREAGAPCADLVLSDPRQGCQGVVAGDWCARWPAGSPDPGLAAAVTASLAAGGTVPWIEIAPPPVAPPVAATGTGEAGSREGVVTPSNLAPFVLALATILVPLAVGFALGRLVLRPARTSSRHLVRRGLPALAIAALAGVAATLPGGPPDAVFALALAVGGLLLGMRTARSGSSRLALALAGSTLLALFVGEVATRLILPETGRFPPPWRARLLTDGEPVDRGDAEGCGLLFPDRSPASFSHRAARVGTRPRTVLHLGDSMVAGMGVTMAEAIPAVLERMEPDAVHVNAGVPGTSADFDLALARRWLPRLKPTVVVIHLYPPNDLTDLGRPWACCGDGPVLDLAKQPPADACPAPRAPPGPVRRTLAGLRRSPPPYAIRVATSFSALARHLVLALVPPDQQAAQGLPTAPVLLERSLEGLAVESAAVGATLVAVIQPSAWDLRGDGDPDGQRDTVTLACRRARVPVLDPADAFRAEASAGRLDPLFLPGDNHLSAEGHRFLASWLALRLPRGVGQAPPRSGSGSPTPAPSP